VWSSQLLRSGRSSHAVKLLEESIRQTRCASRGSKIDV
jgi:hypothetical protein